MSSPLDAFFAPRGVVVIGASTAPEKLGFGVARNLVACGYPGALHFIGRREGELFGRPIRTGLDALPGPIDLAILIVPPEATPQTIEDCGRCGIRGAIIVSAGFREIGPEGAALEAKCIETARAFDVRLLGPNCIGTIDTHLPLDTTFIPPPLPEPGGIGFLSHSGAFCAAILDWSKGEGFGFSRIVSLGNQADVNETDMLPLFAGDPETRVIVMYMEGVPDGRRFLETAGRVSRQKPLIALKVGRFESGQKAAASHTGALAGSDTAFDAAFEKAGVLRADSAQQMFDWARALESSPLPGGRRIAVLTNAGGPGVIAADALEVEGLSLASLGESTRLALAGRLPPAASVNNPVDMLASASPDTYAACLQVLIDDPGVDGLLVILPPPPMFTAEEVVTRMLPIIRRSAKPVILALLGSELVDRAKRILREAGIPAYPFPERAVSALGALANRSEILKRLENEGRTESRAAAPTESSREGLIEAYGISAATIKLARSPRECGELAEALGLPVVLKIASADIPHKSDIGGVIMDVGTAAEADDGYTILMDRAKAARPDARLEGVFVQRQITDGQDVILGATRDPHFGPLMMFGSGGIEVEGFQDVAFALAPLSRAEAQGLIDRTWAGRKLKGFRSIPTVDEAAAVEALMNLSRLIHEHAEVEEIEINPLRVLARGAVALDVRSKFRMV